MSAVDRPYTSKDEKLLMTELWDPGLADNLEAFVMFAYPWGKSGTPLAIHKGPRTWQRDELQKITEHIRNNKIRMELGLPPEVYHSATVSGRGSGKSSFVSWINHWMMTTKIGSTCINTANTEDQLKSKTWAELGKWHTLSINSHWFERQALSLRPADWFKKAVESQLKIDTGYYYSNAQLWSEEKPDAFAGAHNPNGMLLVMDEASGIPQPIWTVSEGFFTEPVLHRYWFVFSNGRRNTGPFFECFHKNRDLWNKRHIDSRTVEGTDPAVFERIIKKYGADSDEARVEVYGQFPRQGDKQFISREIIENAKDRVLEKDPHAALIMGIDVARFGGDKTVFRWRQGRDARSIPPVELKGADNMEVANLAAQWIERTNPDAVCIDAGNGTGVIDRLRERGFKIYEVWFGSKAEEEEWANKRTEMWARMREWLNGGCLDNEPELLDDLAGPEYKYMGASDKIMLEAKEEMKRRGMASPDHGDALACTFAAKVARRDLHTSKYQSKKNRVPRGLDFPLFS